MNSSIEACAWVAWRRLSSRVWIHAPEPLTYFCESEILPGGLHLVDPKSVARSHMEEYTMAVEHDYYEILGIGRSASAEEIKEAVKAQTRTWRKRTEAADLSIRQEAETRVKLIEEARSTLSHDSKKSQYDTKLQREGVKQAEQTSVANSGAGWAEQAKHFLTIGDYHSAVYAAREATQQAGNTADNWYLRSRANAGLDRLDDAWYEAQQAAQIESNNPEFQFHVGAVAEEMGKLDAALNAYKASSRLSDEPMYELAVGGVLLTAGRSKEALDVIRKVHARVPDDKTANYYMGSALLDAAERVPAIRSDDGYVVTSAEEVAEMRSLTQRTFGLNHVDDETREWARQIDAYLDDMEKKQLNRAAFGTLMSGGADMGCLGMAIVPVLLLVPALMLIGGLTAIASGGFIWMLIGAALLFGEYKMFWVPGWKINKSIHK